jgi:GLPGLI family protein
MKISKSLIFILFTLSIYSQENISIVKYSKKIILLKPLDSIKDINVRLRIQNKINNSKTIEFNLIYDSIQSSFEEIKTLKSDANTNFVSGKYSGGGRGVYYLNTTNKEKIHQFELLGENVLVEHFYNNYEWDIIAENKTILGYNCFKAKTTIINESKQFKSEPQEVIAWFAPEIINNFGPSGYDGLPGLVLEVQIGNIIFEAKDIHMSNELKIIKPEKGKKMSYKESIEFFDNIIAKTKE